MFESESGQGHGARGVVQLVVVVESSSTDQNAGAVESAGCTLSRILGHAHVSMQAEMQAGTQLTVLPSAPAANSLTPKWPTKIWSVTTIVCVEVFARMHGTARTISIFSSAFHVALNE